MSQFMSMNFNPIALRTAKTPLILDRSECNKVKIPNRAACEPRVQIDRWMDGWMDEICDFTCFSTVFQSYQDEGRMIMKGCVQWNPFYG